jgi:hypothetical protein
MTDPDQGKDETYKNFTNRTESMILRGNSEFYNLLRQDSKSSKIDTEDNKTNRNSNSQTSNPENNETSIKRDS